jgi:2-polyprenyl-3-methyl-5-hydroxy-6-metoxy-1,4-benzoquinol methylase
MSAISHSVPSGAPQSQPSPQLFFDTINAFQKTGALKAAIDLDLFTAIAEGNHTSEAIALRCQASQRGIRILSDYLVVIGFLTKSGDQYQLTPDTRVFLDRHSPAYIGGATGFLLEANHVRQFDDVAGAVRKGGTLRKDDESPLQPEHDIWVSFANAMGKMQTLTAELLAKLLHVEGAQNVKVLDIAAGHGIFGITLARHNPHAEIVALDWKNVLEVARKNAEQAGVSGQWRALPGNAFEVDYGDNYDVILLTNIIHHFDKPTTEKLLKRVHAALAPNGRAVMVEFIPNEDRVSPPMAAAFPLTMLVETPGGDAYTFAEHQQMLKNAGFQREELHELPPSFFRAIIARK